MSKITHVHRDNSGEIELVQLDDGKIMSRIDAAAKAMSGEFWIGKTKGFQKAGDDSSWVFSSFIQSRLTSPRTQMTSFSPPRFCHSIKKAQLREQ